MAELFLIVLVSSIAFAFAGSFVAKNKGISQRTGVLFGLFLGPIGLIIVALLSPASTSRVPPSAQFSGDRDLNGDKYQLWLTQKYDITRNDTLGRYVVADKSFATLEEALRRADHLEHQRIEQRVLETERREEIRRRWKRVVLVGLLILAALALGRWIYNYLDHQKAVRTADQALENRRKELSDALATASLPLIESAELVAPNYRSSLSNEELRGTDFLDDRSGVGGPKGGIGETCSVNTFGSIYTTDYGGKEVSFTTPEQPDQVRKFYEERLRRNGFKVAQEFDGGSASRFEYANGTQVIFAEASRLEEMTTGPTTFVTICILRRGQMGKLMESKRRAEREMNKAQAKADAAQRALSDQIKETQKLIDSF